MIKVSKEIIEGIDILAESNKIDVFSMQKDNIDLYEAVINLSAYISKKDETFGYGVLMGSVIMYKLLEMAIDVKELENDI